MDGRGWKAFRHYRGLTQKELAELVGIEHYTILNIEKGLVVPSPDLERKLRAVLGDDLARAIGGGGDDTE